MIGGIIAEGLTYLVPLVFVFLVIVAYGFKWRNDLDNDLKDF